MLSRPYRPNPAQLPRRRRPNYMRRYGHTMRIPTTLNRAPLSATGLLITQGPKIPLHRCSTPEPGVLGRRLEARNPLSPTRPDARVPPPTSRLQRPLPTR
jgi:hypothetical protein